MSKSYTVIVTTAPAGKITFSSSSAQRYASRASDLVVPLHAAALVTDLPKQSHPSAHAGSEGVAAHALQLMPREHDL